MLCPLIGEMVTISCAVTGTSSYMISGPGGTSNSMDLVINSFQESDAGTYMYQCTASNPCGSSTDTITIIFTGMFVCLVVCVHMCVYVFVCYINYLLFMLHELLINYYIYLLSIYRYSSNNFDTTSWSPN